MRNPNSQTSRIVNRCQSCKSNNLRSILFLGYLPPVNALVEIGSFPKEQPAYPAELLICPKCHLAQLGLIVNPAILFPTSYPYTSGTTKILRDNFSELYNEVQNLYPLEKSDLVVDIGSNDGTLLANFQSKHRIVGIEPTGAGKLAKKKNIPIETAFFTKKIAQKLCKKYGRAKLITCTNCFAHMDDINQIVDGVKSWLAPDGIFVTESHYLASLVDTIQYDTIYHEHLRYYSVTSLRDLFERHGMKILQVKKIPTHGGSIRVYTARTGKYEVANSVSRFLEEEKNLMDGNALHTWKHKILLSKLGLYSLLLDIRKKGERIYGIGAPSRASTLIHYLGLDDSILECVLEVSTSYKVGKYIPGTRIPILDEARLLSHPPNYALLLSWHIAEELMPKLREKGYGGGFIIPLPTPRVVHPSSTVSMAA